MDLDTLQKKLQRIKKLGFVQTHRVGDTGIGKTLEDLLRIKENNIPLHDIAGVAELKADIMLDDPRSWRRELFSG